MTEPCDNCPFRSDKKFPIGQDRIEEIINNGIFPCHKTVDYEDEDHIEDIDYSNTIACAGLLILLEKENMPDQMMRINERLGLYDNRKLNMDAPVYDSADECIEDKL